MLIILGNLLKGLDPKRKEKEKKAQEVARLQKIMLDAKKVLHEWQEQKTVLTHAQIHLLAKSLGLEFGHYSQFTGKTPADKIFSMKPLATAEKVYLPRKVAHPNNNLDGVFIGVHGNFLTSNEVAEIKKYTDALIEKKGYHIEVLYGEYPAIFVLAPQELFAPVPSLQVDLDPVVVEMTGKDQYTVQTFWNVPEKFAVHLSKASEN